MKNATSIMLVGGTLFDLADPDGSDFTINDIAHGLGRVCRFAGHTSQFYSVAEHCQHVARIVPINLSRAALLHDAAEAFIGDVTRPLKAMLPDYQAVEHRIETTIYRRFLGDDESLWPWNIPEIKAADIAMCAVEARFLMPHLPGYWDQLAPAEPYFSRASGTRLPLDNPAIAAAKYIGAWNRYSHGDAASGAA